MMCSYYDATQNHSLVHTTNLGSDLFFPSDFKFLLVLVVLQLCHSCGARFECAGLFI